MFYRIIICYFYGIGKSLILGNLCYNFCTLCCHWKHVDLQWFLYLLTVAEDLQSKDAEHDYLWLS